MDDLVAFEDPNHPGNGPDFHTGKACANNGCDKPAGTAWSPWWCFDCNVERIKRINTRLTELTGKAKEE